jgi:hypothetical protein
MSLELVVKRSKPFGQFSLVLTVIFSISGHRLKSINLHISFLCVASANLIKGIWRDQQVLQLEPCVLTNIYI